MKKLLLLMLFIAVVFPMMAQEDDELTIDEAYLRQAQKIMVIQTMAYENDSDAKLDALENISELVEDGTFDGESEPIIQVLQDLGMEGTARIYMENGRITNYYTDVRIKAAEVLGQMGGEKAVNALMQIMRTDDEPAVLAEAVKSIAANVTDADVTPQLVMADIIYSQTAINKDNRLAFEFLEAVEVMADNNIEIADVVIEEVVKIANRRNGYNKDVADYAKEVLVNRLF